MKLLLIGPYPPPHGGISVHVAEADKQLRKAGIPCRVLNTDPRAPASDRYLSVRNGVGLSMAVLRHAGRGWTLHLHTNGHNWKSWLLTLLCGLLGKLAPARLLTLHSGMVPLYLEQGPRWKRPWRRALARLACLQYDRIVAVNSQGRATLAGLGIAPDRVVVVPAYVSAAASAPVPALLDAFMRCCSPLITSVLFFRPEYGFDLLVQAVKRLRRRYPKIACLVMGSGEQQAQAERLICKERLEDALWLLGDVSHELCLTLIARSDVFVRTTLEDADAVSVREALALGVPAVASDVGTRPPGALLFRSGSLDDLTSKLAGAFWHGHRPRRSPQPSGNGLGRLLEIYENGGPLHATSDRNPSRACPERSRGDRKGADNAIRAATVSERTKAERV